MKKLIIGTVITTVIGGLIIEVSFIYSLCLLAP